jgi:hypothetical protein
MHTKFESVDIRGWISQNTHKSKGRRYKDQRNKLGNIGALEEANRRS